jgi:hypothetical protein
MLDINLYSDDLTAAAEIPSLNRLPFPGQPQDGPHFAAQFLAPLHHAIASWHHRMHQGRSQVIIRFHNGYGAILSEYRLVKGTYEIAPLQFHGPGPDDYELYFRSHVADLTWCSDQEDIVRVCQQIARLLSRPTV